MNNNFVYKYTNKINGKIYIGRTFQPLKQRAGKNGNGYKTCTRFWNAICKYGWNNFELEILAENLLYDESIEIERKYIIETKSHLDEFGYNILTQEPGEGPFPEETKLTISKALKDLNAGIRQKRTKSSIHERTVEHAKHLSESLKGNIPWNKGKKTGPLPEYVRNKMSAIRINNTNSIHKAVKNVTTGEIFRSGAAAGRSIGCSSEAIFASIRENRLCKGYKFELLYE